MTDLNALAARCEQATGPDRELDARIEASLAEADFDALEHDGVHVRDWEAPRYTESLDAAMQLVPEGWHVGGLTECDEDDAPHCCLTENDEPCRDVVGDGADMILSLCAAALRALASAGEAGTAETQSGSVHEHAVPKADAQTGDTQ